MTAMGEQIKVSDAQMQFLQKKALIQRSHRRISNNGRQNSHQNSKMLAAIFSDEKFSQYVK